MTNVAGHILMPNKLYVCAFRSLHYKRKDILTADCSVQYRYVDPRDLRVLRLEKRGTWHHLVNDDELKLSCFSFRHSPNGQN